MVRIGRAQRLVFRRVARVTDGMERIVFLLKHFHITPTFVVLAHLG